MQHVAEILAGAASQCPERVAIVELDAHGTARASFTYDQWRTAAAAWAGWLGASDVMEGERVALMVGNGFGFAAQWFGIVAAGCTVVPIPVTSSVADVRHRVEHAGCRVVIVDEARFELAVRAIVSVSPRPIVVVDRDVQTDDVTPRALPALGEGGEASAMVLYTSGTTGRAKGACISHRALIEHTRILTEQVLRLGAADRVLGVLPLTHSYGCRMLLLAVAHARAQALLMSRFDAGVSLAALDQHAITWVPAVPTMFAAWCQAAVQSPADRPRSGTLAWAMSAGAPIADALVHRAEAVLGTQVRQAYGMTEATLSTINGPRDARVVGSVGRAVPGVSLRIVDVTGSDVAAGSSGEIWVRGHNLMSGYLDDDAATQQAMGDGWFRSGDVGRIDADGNLWVVDRIKDLIIRGGYNVYPSEVEAVIAQHPQVAEVAVVGRPDAYYGEEVVAVVVRRHDALLDADSLLAWCEHHLSKTQRPREVRFVERMPLGPSGKVLKRVLRDGGGGEA